MAHKNVLVVRKAALAVATALALVSVSLTETAQAAGLGALTVQSALGQPLRAEVEVTSVTPEELQTLSARLASQQAFKQAGIEFNPALTTARFSLDKRNGRNIIRVTTTQPINEPFVDLLVELNWATGRLVREYTFLLDPPELRVGKAPEAIAPASTMPAPTPAQVSPAPASSETATAATPSTSALATTPESKPEQKTESPATSASTSTQATKTDTAAPSTEIKVKSGDSLSKIAARNLPSDVTLEQMLVALYRANPQSFAGNNMNRLKAGSILRVPEATEATAVAAPVARKEVVVQAKDFANYRSNLAGAVAKSVSAVATTAPATQAAQGQVTPKVEDKAAPKAEAKDQVKLARPQTATQPGTIAGGGAAAQADSAIAKEKALKEANQRVAELQRNISEMQKTLAQQNEAMAKAQEAAKNKASSPSPTAAPAPGKAEPPKA
ncbi:MAG: FimV family protein, partial [Burkholderiales bacterium]